MGVVFRQPGVSQNHRSGGWMDEEKTNLLSMITRKCECDKLSGVSNSGEKGAAKNSSQYRVSQGHRWKSQASGQPRIHEITLHPWVNQSPNLIDSPFNQ